MNQKKEYKICESCGAKFSPYSSRQRVCHKTACRMWLREQNYRKVEYMFSADYIKKNSGKDLRELRFTRDDLIKMED